MGYRTANAAMQRPSSVEPKKSIRGVKPHSEQQQSSHASGRSAKTIVLSAGKLLSSLLLFATFAVLSRILDKHGYATYRQTILVFQVVAPIMLLGLPQAIYFFLPTEGHRVRGRLLDILIIFTFTTTVLSLCLWLSGTRIIANIFHNPDLETTLWYIPPYLFFMLPLTGVVTAILICRDRVFLLAVFNVLSRLLMGIGIILPLLIWRTPASSLAGNVAATAVAWLIGVSFVAHVVPPDSCTPSIRSMKEMLCFGVPAGAAALFGTISRQLDKLVVSSACSPDTYAVFANGAFEPPVVDVITSSISAVLLVEMRHAFENGDREEVLRLFRLGAEKSALILYPCLAFLMVAATPFIETLFSSDYRASAAPFRIYLLLLPMRIVVFGNLMVAIGRPRIVMLQGFVGLLLNGVLSFILVNSLGPTGAAWGNVITNYVAAAMYAVVISHIFQTGLPCLLPWVRLFVIARSLVVPTLCTAAIIWLLADMPSWMSLLLSGVFFALWWLAAFHRDVRRIASAVLFRKVIPS